MFSFVGRAKVVKNLLLDKLDIMLQRVEALDQFQATSLKNFSDKLDAVLLRIEAHDQHQTSSLENDSSFLEALAYLVKTVQGQTLLQNQLYFRVKNLERQQKQFLEMLNSSQQQGMQMQQITDCLGLLQQQLATSQKPQAAPLPRVNIVTHQYSIANPELGLMHHLYSQLPYRTAIDIGAHTGEVSESLLRSGYEVYAFEPYPPVFDRLSRRLADTTGCHSYCLALGSTDGEMAMHVATDFSKSGRYEDTTVFNSLLLHAMPSDLQFTSTVQVQVRSLISLHQDQTIPQDIGLVKIDTEGFELEVLRGMGHYRYPVVVTEFWDANIDFAKAQTFNKIEDQVKEMRQRGYYWHLVLYRIYGSYEISFYSSSSHSLENSWGNIFFFQSHSLFSEAMAWCSATLPITYFS